MLFYIDNSSDEDDVDQTDDLNNSFTFNRVNFMNTYFKTELYDSHVYRNYLILF